MFEDITKVIALSPGILHYISETKLKLICVFICYAPIRGRLVESLGGEQGLVTFLTFKNMGPGDSLRFHAYTI